MFGKKNESKNMQTTDVTALNFDDLVELGLIDQGLALSIKDYIDENDVPKEKNSEQVPVTPEIKGEGEALKVVTFPEKIVQEPAVSTPASNEGTPSPSTTIEASSGTDEAKDELAQVLLDAKRYAKEQKRQAEQEASEMIAAAKEKIRLLEFEQQQREVLLQRKYQQEAVKLQEKFQQMALYFQEMHASSQELLGEYEKRCLALVDQLEEMK